MFYCCCCTYYSFLQLLLHLWAMMMWWLYQFSIDLSQILKYAISFITFLYIQLNKIHARVLKNASTSIHIQYTFSVCVFWAISHTELVTNDHCTRIAMFIPCTAIVYSKNKITHTQRFNTTELLNINFRNIVFILWSLMLRIFNIQQVRRSNYYQFLVRWCAILYLLYVWVFSQPYSEIYSI